MRVEHVSHSVSIWWNNKSNRLKNSQNQTARPFISAKCTIAYGTKRLPCIHIDMVLRFCIDQKHTQIHMSKEIKLERTRRERVRERMSDRYVFKPALSHTLNTPISVYMCIYNSLWWSKTCQTIHYIWCT